MSKTKYYVRIVIGVLMVFICGISTFGSIANYSYYKDAYNYTIEQMTLKEEMSNAPTSGFIEGKEALENPHKFDSMFYKGKYDHQSQYLSGATSLYKNLGIQLYVWDFYFTETFASKEALEAEIQKSINSLDNLDYSIVYYSYSTEADYDEPGYYYASDCVYYGDTVLDYLSPEDIQLLQYYIKNAYNLWSYEDNRESNVWVAFSEDVMNGYDRNAMGSTQSSYKDQYLWDLDYYNEQIGYSIVQGIICAVLTLIGLALIVTGAFTLRKATKLEHERIEAEIELKKAEATARILEADIPDYDESLINKYTQ